MLTFLLAAACCAFASAAEPGTLNPEPRVIPLSEILRAQEARRPETMPADGARCYRGFPVPAGAARLPDYHAFTGPGRNEYLIPITRDPQRHLEPGDVLVYPRPVERDASGLHDAVTLGQFHAAIVGKSPRTGALFVLHAPKEHSSDLEALVPFHILRLDPAHAGRDAILDKVARFVRVLSSGTSRYSYDFQRVTEPNMPGELPRLAAALEQGRCPAGLSLYCSELVALVYGAAGVPPPARTHSLLYALPAVESRLRAAHAALPPGQALPYERFVDRAVEELLQDAELRRELGFVAGVETAAQRAELAQAENALKDLLKARPEDRARLFLSRKLFPDGKGEIIGPAEYFLAPLVEGGRFSYVGTYLGRGCAPRAPGALDAVAPRLAPAVEESLKSDPFRNR